MRVNNSGKFNVQSMSELTTHRNSTIQGCFTEQDRTSVIRTCDMDFCSEMS